ncbi:hypothetical protein LSH36_241g02011 [Paralvinella palmiformis]|uniref:Guanylate cyclase n=1 Tax=Paralvinella palmiformis TaxID=53620 RepID=A0AAD9N4R6_9ANNE|nr:hypothetical protein LSH36_241g02011 [Paralvinella palmiformis]
MNHSMADDVRKPLQEKMNRLLSANYLCLMFITMAELSRCLVDARVFNVAIMLPLKNNSSDDERSEDIVRFITEFLNSDHSLANLRSDGHDIRLSWSKTNCDEGTALMELVSIISDNTIKDAIIGPGCDVECTTLALLASQADVPMISYGCGASVLSDKNRFPTFSRTLPPDVDMSPFLTKVIQHFGWRNVIIIKSADTNWMHAAYVFEVGDNTLTTTSIMASIVNRSFTGTHGLMFIQSNGDAIANYTLTLIQNGSLVPLLDYYTSSDILISYNTTISLADGATAPSFSKTLIRGLSKYNALINDWSTRRRQRYRMLLSTQWKISFNAIDMNRKNHCGSQFGSTISRDTTLYGSVRSDSSNKITVSNVGRQQLYTKIGLYQGHMVAVKEIRKKYIYLSNEVICEMNEVMNLHHTNLNVILGACVEPNHIFVVSEYCSKGSLQDVLENENIRLDRIFNISFASDIAQGMVFLHNSVVQYHGNLKSSNVLIDTRWTCKLTDFGLRRFREGERKLLPGDPSYYYQLFWTAPEHLREEVTVRGGSQKGDVYSYAMILQEILTRSTPYCDISDDPQYIIERLEAGDRPVLRPKILSSSQNEDKLVDVMRMCWEEIPAFRPNFVTVTDSLKKLNKGRHTNLVDQMLQMMEKYANQLEDLVDERTKQLAGEQRKTEELLCRMLPRSVAEKLKSGLTVAPESYPSVTIFFSDIVGFTSLAAASTPMQVVDFLNDLYTCFDAVTENFDVYKVETIGDAYMVVSGLPARNGLKHAGEICTMSLDLLSAVRSFRIKHMPKKQLQLRCGVHTGPVVAGVVGMKMPRYCLFGDTVNYASRMESSGFALRIHVSPECKSVLDQLGGYHLEERGEVTMKGKGTVRTYFLLGKEGFQKELPDISKAVPIEEHEFK